MTPPRTQTPSLRLLNGGAPSTSGVETLEVISPELALVDPELAIRARAGLRTYDGDELVAAVQRAPDADEIAPEPSSDEETVLSPELALVDPELADRARAELADGEPASSAAHGRQPEQSPRPLRPSRVPQRADRAEPLEPTRRARRKGSSLPTRLEHLSMTLSPVNQPRREGVVCDGSPRAGAVIGLRRSAECPSHL